MANYYTIVKELLNYVDGVFLGNDPNFRWATCLILLGLILLIIPLPFELWRVYKRF